MKLLHLDASILGDHSVSRQLSADIVARLRSLSGRMVRCISDSARVAPKDLLMPVICRMGVEVMASHGEKRKTATSSVHSRLPRPGMDTGAGLHAICGKPACVRPQLAGTQPL